MLETHDILRYSRDIERSDPMEIRTLTYFLAVAEEGNITKAARKLHMTQPSLSRQMMDLEKELGRQLFIRTSKRTLLTEDGIRLKQRAQEILALVEKTTVELQAPSEEIRGTIYFGAGETDIMRIVARVIAQLRQSHPGIHISLYSGNADDILEKLDHGVLDFGLVFGPQIPEKYNCLPVPFPNAVGMLLRKDSYWANYERITKDQFVQMPLIMPSRSSYIRSFLTEWCREDTDTFNVVAVYNLIFNASFLVESGVGNALCLENLVNVSPDSPLCFRPLEPAAEEYLTLVWKRGRKLSRPCELLLCALKERFHSAQ